MRKLQLADKPMWREKASSQWKCTCCNVFTRVHFLISFHLETYCIFFYMSKIKCSYWDIQTVNLTLKHSSTKWKHLLLSVATDYNVKMMVERYFTFLCSNEHKIDVFIPANDTRKCTIANIIIRSMRLWL